MKKLLSVILVAIMLAVTVIGGTACTVGGKFSKLSFTVTYYSYDEKEKTYTATEKKETLTVTLYNHLAPKTCARIKELAKANYFEGAVLYESSRYTTQVMFGDLFYKDGKFTEKHYEKALADTADSLYNQEFSKGGVTGNNLSTEKGVMGLWRDIDRNSTLDYTKEKTYGFGTSTVFMPKSTKSSYDGYFALFGKLGENAIDVLEDLIDELNDSEEYTEYNVYSVAVEENNTAKAVKEGETNFELVAGKEFNFMLKEDFEKAGEKWAEKQEGAENTDLWVNIATYKILKSLPVVTAVKVK